MWYLNEERKMLQKMGYTGTVLLYLSPCYTQLRDGTARVTTRVTARGRSCCDCPLVSADVSIYLPTFQSLDRPSHEHLISAIHAAETGHSRPLFCPAEIEIIYRTIRTKLK